MATEGRVKPSHMSVRARVIASIIFIIFQMQSTLIAHFYVFSNRNNQKEIF